MEHRNEQPPSHHYALSLSPESSQNPTEFPDLTCPLSTKYTNITDYFLINKIQHTVPEKRNLEGEGTIMLRLSFYGGQWVECPVVPETWI